MRHTFWFVLLVILSASLGNAQTAQVARGAPPFGSFGGGPDVINLGNLNAQFTIPVFSRAGRGIPFNFALSYDTSIWYPSNVSGTTMWTPVTNWGWTGTDDLATAAIGKLTSTVSQIHCSGTNYYYAYFWTFTDKLGVKHPFDESDQAFTCGTTTTLNQQAFDTSGYYISVTGSGPGTVTWRSGTLLDATGNQTDNNGNKITVSGSSVYDTLSSTAVLTATGTPASPPVKYGYTNPQGTTSYVTVSYVSHTVHTVFGCSVGDYNQPNIPLVDRVTMPDGSFYAFSYEPTPGYTGQVTGRLASVTFPTGGSISYVYTGGSHGINCADGTASGFTRTVSPGGSSPSGTWTFTHTQVSGKHWQTKVTTPPDPTVGNDTVIDFQQDSGNTTNFYEVQRKAYQGAAGGTPLLTQMNCYNGNFGACVTTAVSNPISQIDAFRQQNGGQTSAVESTFNASGLVTSTLEYDFGVTLGSAPSSTYLKRNTIINYATLGGGKIADHPSQVTVKDGAGTIKAQTTYTYSNTVTATSGTPQHTTPPYTDRGNPITVSSLTSGTSTISKNFTYFDTGNVNVATDVNGATTTYIYASGTSCGNSFPTEVDLPLTLTTYSTWNCPGGVMATSKDANGNTTTYEFTDPNYWRLMKVDNPDGGGTTYTYNTTSAPWDTATSTKQTATANITRDTVFDGLGRVSQTQLTSDPAGDDFVDTTYDALGRMYSVSNPHRSTSSPTDGTTVYNYDALGRTTRITNPDNSYRTFTYASRATEAVDESGITKIYQVDGLGRLVGVCDGVGATAQFNGPSPSTCAGLDISGNGFLATYIYDPLNNITNASIGASTGYTPQTSAFTYDGLSRLLTENVPEIPNASCGGSSHAKCYAYDTGTGGDLSTVTFEKPDGSASVSAQYTWDALHRLTLLHYSDGSSGYGYSYDQSTWLTWTLNNGKGRLTSQSHSGGAAAAYSYDPMGRPVWEGSCAGANCYGTVRGILHAYDYTGNVTAVTDSYTGQITKTLNTAGQITAVTSAWNDSTHPGTLFSAATYTPLSGLAAGTYGDNNGTGTVRTNTYDNRGRLTEIQDGSGPTYRLFLTYNPNSTISVYQDNVTGRWNYTYDAFNRLATAVLTQTGNPNAPNYSYYYDQYGNRWQQHLVSGSGNEVDYTFNAYNKNASFLYDYMGNVTRDAVCGANPCWTYDYAGHLTSGNGASYLYDGLGRRQQKTEPGGTVRSFVLDGDNPFTEYAPSFTRATGGFFTYANGSTYFNRTDDLSMPRLSTDYTGATKRTEGVLMGPFGDGFSETASPFIDFTGYDGGFWDSENDAEQFGAREYENIHGSWLQPDPAGLAAVDPSNPQTWNRYAYVTNNPTSFVDPSGLLLQGPCRWTGGGSACGSGGGGGADETPDCDLWYDPLCGLFGGGGGEGGGGIGSGGGGGWGTGSTGGGTSGNGSSGTSVAGTSVPWGEWGTANGLPPGWGGTPGFGCEFGVCDPNGNESPLSFLSCGCGDTCACPRAPSFGGVWLLVQLLGRTTWIITHPLSPPKAPTQTPNQDICYQIYLVDTAECGEQHTDDRMYEKCMEVAWLNYQRCKDRLPRI